MRFILTIFVVFFLASSAFSNEQTCRDLFKSQNIENFRKRIQAYFGVNEVNAPALSDAEAASSILKKIALYGSPSHLKMFDLILQVHESTLPNYEVRTPGFYIDLESASRFKSNYFQERHWDWNILDGYFFNGPLTPEFTREQDAEYLRHVLATAQSFSNKVGLKQVLENANDSWVRAKLSKDAKALAEYESFASDKTYDSLYFAMREHFLFWVKSATNTQEKSQRLSQIRFMLQSFKNSHSKFDLMVATEYFDLVTKFQVSFKVHDDVPKWLQLTDTRVFEMTLPYGSLHYVTDFLFQNSHDIAAKLYLLKILNKLKSLGQSGRKGPAFYFEFLNAKNLVDSEIEQNPPPEAYRTDLHIFSKRLQPGSTSDSYDQVLVKWNEILSCPQVNVVKSAPLTPNMLVSSDPELESYVKTYFNNFRQKGTYSPGEIDHDEAQELDASLNDTTYLVFTTHGRDWLKTMIRIFDATHSRTYIEREFPQIKLPERDTGEPIFEIGRLLATTETKGQSLEAIMAPVAEYFKNTNSTGSVYLDANRSAMILYKRIGAEVIFTPENLNLASNATPLWILRFSVQEIIGKFYKPTYKSVQLRKPPSHE